MVGDGINDAPAPTASVGIAPSGGNKRCTDQAEIGTVEIEPYALSQLLYGAFGQACVWQAVQACAQSWQSMQRRSASLVLREPVGAKR
jgi:hypothetical protein